MCLSVYFFLDGTAQQLYINNEGKRNSLEKFKTAFNTLYGDRQKYSRKTKENLKDSVLRKVRSQTYNVP